MNEYGKSLINFKDTGCIVKSTKKSIGDHKYMITDDKGKNIIVDTENGRVYRILKSGKLKELCTKRDKQNGYLYVSIEYEGRVIAAGLHTLVAMLEYGVPDEYMVANHMNNDPVDNRAENLEWVTGSQNSRHSTFLVTLYNMHGLKYMHRNKNGRVLMDFPVSYKEVDRLTARLL